MRYLLGLLGVVGLIILVVVLIVRGLSGDDTVKTTKPLVEYSHSNAVMQLTVDGPVESQSTHQAVRVSVGQYQAKAEILNGYPGLVADTISYPNNAEAYGVFLRALDLLNFNVGIDDQELRDARGYCPDGNLYTLEIYEEGKQVQRYWRTSCKEGTFRGELGRITDLFEKQIPDYGNFVKDVTL